MTFNFKNLIFEGGGVWGIGYLGMLKELDERGIIPQIEKVGGSSAGAITSLATSFNLSYDEIAKIANSLVYSQIPQAVPSDIPKFVVDIMDKAAEAINALLKPIESAIGFHKELTGEILFCLLRMHNHYGYYSSDYFYKWLQRTIASQFRIPKLHYTFRDFQNHLIHKDGRKFKDLYITGTDVSNKREYIFSAQTTPDLEVATAVRISMSIPFFFESINLDVPTQGDYTSGTYTFSDGGTMLNYPISLFDRKEFGGNGTTNYATLGGHFKPSQAPTHGAIPNLKDYALQALLSMIGGQGAIYENTPEDKIRTIDIDTFDISAVDFNIKTDDAKYQRLFTSGLEATRKYLDNYKPHTP